MCMETSQLQPICTRASRHLFVAVDEQTLALAVDRIIGKETTPEPHLIFVCYPLNVLVEAVVPF